MSLLLTNGFPLFICTNWSMDRRNWNLGVEIVAILNRSDDQKEKMTPCANKKKTKKNKKGLELYIGREWSLSTCSIYYSVDPVWEEKHFCGLSIETISESIVYRISRHEPKKKKKKQQQTWKMLSDPNQSQDDWIDPKRLIIGWLYCLGLHQDDCVVAP